MSAYAIILLKHPDDEKMLAFLNAGAVILDGGRYATAVVTEWDEKNQIAAESKLLALLHAKLFGAYLTIETEDK